MLEEIYFEIIADPSSQHEHLPTVAPLFGVEFSRKQTFFTVLDEIGTGPSLLTTSARTNGNSRAATKGYAASLILVMAREFHPSASRHA